MQTREQSRRGYQVAWLRRVIDLLFVLARSFVCRQSANLFVAILFMLVPLLMCYFVFTFEYLVVTF